MATIQLETNRPCSGHVDPAPIGRAWPYLDVEPHVERPPDTLQLNVERPTGARRALSEIGILELLVHGASQLAQTSPRRREEHVQIEAVGHGRRPLSLSASMRRRTVSGRTQAETALAEALQGASGDTHTRVGHHLGGWVQWTRVYL